MRFLVVFAAFVFMAASCGSSFAISEAEYVQLLQNSAKFRDENTRLADQLESMRNTFKGDAWKKILQGHNAWLASGIDIAAKKNMAEGYTRAYAYAKATHDHTANLWALELNYKRTPQEISEGYTDSPAEYDGPSGSEYGMYDGERMGIVSKIIPVDLDLSQVRIRDSYGRTHIYYISRKDIAARVKKFRDDNNEYGSCNYPEPREGGLYNFEVIGNATAPALARKLGEKNRTVKIIGNFSQCFG